MKKKHIERLKNNIDNYYQYKLVENKYNINVELFRFRR